ncbi:glycoside hydrolase family 28 protein [Granulicella sp. WH15]|uniref:glycoside hydrolase family 28 protein n=1 Tax=Granulicella sp. WH15 TaxID=2602070 RepID=UPI0013673BD5|nr:glycoside hydrolase family 28 protein [Granulicella sp. WH15]QHN03001.1 glycoside hydrolase family 28 protein [Granulicella sp. WH15]
MGNLYTSVWAKSVLNLGAAVVVSAGLASSVQAKMMTCDAHAFGAKGDGKTKDTAALQRAIDQCAKKSGGVVHLGSGTYVSAPLDLKSHVHLQLDKDATLLGSPDREDYPIREDAKWRKVSLIHADHAVDIGITGEGTVDGNGHVWWEAKAEDHKRGAPEAPRPLLIDITNSKQILIEGVTIQNSPQYNITTFWCDGLTVRNVKILNPGRTAPNTDGIDPVSTSHVLIEHDLIDTGDDNIAIKSGLVERGDPNVPSTDIVVRDCILRNGHGLSIGSEVAGGVRNVTVERVTFAGTRQGIRIKSARGRGNDVGNFVYRDITMEDVETPIEITNYYTGLVKNDPGQPVTEHTPRFHDITIENVTATGAKRAGVIMGLPESPIKNVVLKNVHLTAATGMTMQYAQVSQDGLVITPASGDALTKGPGLTINGK